MVIEEDSNHKRMHTSSSGCLVSDMVSPTQCYMMGERLQGAVGECLEFENNQNDLLTQSEQMMQLTTSNNNRMAFGDLTNQQRLDQLLMEEDCDVIGQCGPQSAIPGGGQGSSRHFGTHELQPNLIAQQENKFASVTSHNGLVVYESQSSKPSDYTKTEEVQ